MSTNGITSTAATFDGSTATTTSDPKLSPVAVQGVKRTTEQVFADLVADGSDPFIPTQTSLGISF